MHSDTPRSRAGGSKSAERLIPGLREGDTPKGKFNRPAVGNKVERSTCFALFARTNGITAEATVDGFSRTLARIEAQHKFRLTYDRLARYTVAVWVHDVFSTDTMKLVPVSPS